MGRPKKTPDGEAVDEIMEATTAHGETPQTHIEAEPDPETTPGNINTPDTTGGESEMEALRRQVEELTRKLEERPSVVMAKPDKVVELTYIAAVSQDNVTSLGSYGSLHGVGGYIEIPRKEFGGKFLTPVVRSMLAKRHLIVCSGLNEEERRRYGVDYKAGELLDIQAFDRLLDFDLEQLKTLFSKLCPEHRQFIATRFITAYEAGDNRISREKVEPLNELSKQTDPDGLFRPILTKMNQDI